MAKRNEAPLPEAPNPFNMIKGCNESQICFWLLREHESRSRWRKYHNKVRELLFDRMMLDLNVRLDNDPLNEDLLAEQCFTIHLWMALCVDLDVKGTPQHDTSNCEDESDGLEKNQA